jgi:hypothetical protein
MEVIEPSGTPRTSSRKKFATLVTTIVAASTLSLTAAPTLGATVHAAIGFMRSGVRVGGGGHGHGVTPDSHRLALGSSVRPDSLRLT